MCDFKNGLNKIMYVFWAYKEFREHSRLYLGFPGGAVVKNSPANAGDTKDQVWYLGQEDSLEEEVATHSRIRAWRIPRTKDPCGLQAMGLQRVRHDRVHR